MQEITQSNKAWAVQAAIETTYMNEHFNLSDYDYLLPEENIAQYPLDSRDQSKLMVLNCDNNKTEHKQFTDIIDYFLPGDLLVVNMGWTRHQTR